MPTAIIDGINTRYEVLGSGPPLLMYAPGGFDATIEKWSTQGVYAKIKLLDHLPKHYACILFDRRECGQSGGRVERVTWANFVAQGKGLLDHLGIKRAHLMGGCMGCSPVAAFGVAHPEMVLSMILWWPVGGAKYRISSHQRFAEHLAFIQHNGLEQVAQLAASSGKSFGADPRGGPWASVLRHDRGVRGGLRQAGHRDIQGASSPAWRGRCSTATRRPAPSPRTCCGSIFRRWSIPGQDAAHATSAARYLEECLPRSEYWDVPVSGQTEETAPKRVLEFLSKVERNATR